LLGRVTDPKLVQLEKVPLIDVIFHPLGMVTLERAVQALKAEAKLIPAAAVVVGRVISCRFEQPENKNDDRLLIEVVGKLTLVNPLQLPNEKVVPFQFSGNVNDCRAVHVVNIVVVVHAKPGVTVAGHQHHCIELQPDHAEVKSIVPLVANEVILHQSRLLQFKNALVHVVHALSEGRVILVKLEQPEKALAIVVTELSVAGNLTEVKLVQVVHI